jgi:hypothetical protein
MFWGWLCVVIGAIVVGIGGVISTLAWKILSRPNSLSSSDKVRKLIKDRSFLWGSGLVIVSILVIGFGGITAQLGWRKLDKKRQLDTLVFTVARELISNSFALNNPPLIFPPEYKEIGMKHQAYPRFSTQAIHGLYVNGADVYWPLLLSLLYYERAAGICNVYFAEFDTLLARPMSQVERASQYEKIVKDFAPLEEFRGFDEMLRSGIMQEYPKIWKRAITFAEPMIQKQEQLQEPLRPGSSN